MTVMSVRLSEQELKRLRAVAEREHKEQSSIVRELLMEGLKYKMLMAYRQGNVSLGWFSRILGINFSVAIDLLASVGIPAPVTYDEYLQGITTAKRSIH